MFHKFINELLPDSNKKRGLTELTSSHKRTMFLVESRVYYVIDKLCKNNTSSVFAFICILSSSNSLIGCRVAGLSYPLYFIPLHKIITATHHFHSSRIGEDTSRCNGETQTLRWVSIYSISNIFKVSWRKPINFFALASCCCSTVSGSVLV